MTIVGQPSVNFSRKIWWDSLLTLYAAPATMRLDGLSASQRNLAIQGITSDLRFLFRTSNYWFAFLHAPTFFNNFYDPSRRDKVQPSLIYAALAMATLWQSSEIELGQRGRDKALKFREEVRCSSPTIGIEANLFFRRRAPWMPVSMPGGWTRLWLRRPG